jgi:predicted RNase H-like nuclease (RuvC/YqgF family)
MKTKNEYIDSLASELKEWGAQIDLLAVKTENAKAFAKLKYTGELNALHAKQEVAAAKMEELENASGDAWVTVKETADVVWNDLRSGMASAAAQFK